MSNPRTAKNDSTDPGQYTPTKPLPAIAAPSSSWSTSQPSPCGPSSGSRDALGIGTIESLTVVSAAILAARARRRMSGRVRSGAAAARTLSDALTAAEDEHELERQGRGLPLLGGPSNCRAPQRRITAG